MERDRRWDHPLDRRVDDRRHDRRRRQRAPHVDPGQIHALWPASTRSTRSANAHVEAHGALPERRRSPLPRRPSVVPRSTPRGPPIATGTSAKLSFLRQGRSSIHVGFVLTEARGHAARALDGQRAGADVPPSGALQAALDLVVDEAWRPHALDGLTCDTAAAARHLRARVEHRRPLFLPSRKLRHACAMASVHVIGKGAIDIAQMSPRRGASPRAGRRDRTRGDAGRLGRGRRHGTAALTEAACRRRRGRARDRRCGWHPLRDGPPARRRPLRSDPTSTCLRAVPTRRTSTRERRPRPRERPRASEICASSSHVQADLRRS